MKIRDVVEILNCEVLAGEDKLDAEFDSIGASDMMSDILALSKPNMLALTGHTTPQVVRTSMVTSLLGIVILRGKNLPPATLQMAQANNVLLMRTHLGMFTSCGKLYDAGFRGGDE